MTSNTAQVSGGLGQPEDRTVETFDPTAMHAVGARPPLRKYLQDLWASRYFILYDARVRLAVSQDHTLLGLSLIHI